MLTKRQLRKCIINFYMSFPTLRRPTRIYNQYSLKMYILLYIIDTTLDSMIQQVFVNKRNLPHPDNTPTEYSQPQFSLIALAPASHADTRTARASAPLAHALSSMPPLDTYIALVLVVLVARSACSQVRTGTPPAVVGRDMYGVPLQLSYSMKDFIELNKSSALCVCDLKPPSHSVKVKIGKGCYKPSKHACHKSDPEHLFVKDKSNYEQRDGKIHRLVVEHLNHAPDGAVRLNSDLPALPSSAPTYCSKKSHVSKDAQRKSINLPERSVNIEQSPNSPASKDTSGAKSSASKYTASDTQDHSVEQGEAILDVLKDTGHSSSKHPVSTMSQQPSVGESHSRSMNILPQICQQVESDADTQPFTYTKGHLMHTARTFTAILSILHKLEHSKLPLFKTFIKLLLRSVASKVLRGIVRQSIAANLNSATDPHSAALFIRMFVARSIATEANPALMKVFFACCADSVKLDTKSHFALAVLPTALTQCVPGLMVDLSPRIIRARTGHSTRRSRRHKRQAKIYNHPDASKMPIVTSQKSTEQAHDALDEITSASDLSPVFIADSNGSFAQTKDVGLWQSDALVADRCATVKESVESAVGISSLPNIAEPDKSIVDIDQLLSEMPTQPTTPIQENQKKPVLQLETESKIDSILQRVSPDDFGSPDSPFNGSTDQSLLKRKTRHSALSSAFASNAIHPVFLHDSTHSCDLNRSVEVQSSEHRDVQTEISYKKLEDDRLIYTKSVEIAGLRQRLDQASSPATSESAFSLWSLETSRSDASSILMEHSNGIFSPSNIAEPEDIVSPLRKYPAGGSNSSSNSGSQSDSGTLANAEYDPVSLDGNSLGTMLADNSCRGTWKGVVSPVFFQSVSESVKASATVAPFRRMRHAVSENDLAEMTGIKPSESFSFLSNTPRRHRERRMSDHSKRLSQITRSERDLDLENANHSVPFRYLDGAPPSNSEAAPRRIQSARACWPQGVISPSPLVANPVYKWQQHSVRLMQKGLEFTADSASFAINSTRAAKHEDDTFETLVQSDALCSSECGEDCESPHVSTELQPAHFEPLIEVPLIEVPQDKCSLKAVCHSPENNKSVHFQLPWSACPDFHTGRHRSALKKSILGGERVPKRVFWAHPNATQRDAFDGSPKVYPVDHTATFGFDSISLKRLKQVFDSELFSNVVSEILGAWNADQVQLMLFHLTEAHKHRQTTPLGALNYLFSKYVDKTLRYEDCRILLQTRIVSQDLHEHGREHISAIGGEADLYTDDRPLESMLWAWSICNQRISTQPMRGILKRRNVYKFGHPDRPCAGVEECAKKLADAILASAAKPAMSDALAAIRDGLKTIDPESQSSRIFFDSAMRMLMRRDIVSDREVALYGARTTHHKLRMAFERLRSRAGRRIHKQLAKLFFALESTLEDRDACVREAYEMQWHAFQAAKTAFLEEDIEPTHFFGIFNSRGVTHCADNAMPQIEVCISNLRVLSGVLNDARQAKRPIAEQAIAKDERADYGQFCARSLQAARTGAIEEQSGLVLLPEMLRGVIANEAIECLFVIPQLDVTRRRRELALQENGSLRIVTKMI